VAKLLIDECLHTSLLELAHAAGHIASKRAVEALPFGWPSNNSKPRTPFRKTNNQPSRSFLAYLA
jgi:hypothetical protein